MEAIRAERDSAAAISQRRLQAIAASLPEHLPREVHHTPSSDACPECGGELRKFGEDVSRCWSTFHQLQGPAPCAP